jgi:hypothetical protein
VDPGTGAEATTAAVAGVETSAEPELGGVLGVELDVADAAADVPPRSWLLTVTAVAVASIAVMERVLTSRDFMGSSSGTVGTARKWTSVLALRPRKARRVLAPTASIGFDLGEATIEE